MNFLRPEPWAGAAPTRSPAHDEIILLNEDGGEAPSREALSDLPQWVYWPRRHG